MCPCAVQPQGSKAGGGLCGVRVVSSHSTGCHSPASRPFCGPLLEQQARPAFSTSATVTGVMRRALGFAFSGQGGGGACGPGPAERAQRALLAQRCAVGQADQRAQLHQGLIVVSGFCGRLVLHDPCRELPLHLRFGDQPGVVVEPGKHPQNVAVHGGHRETEADGRNGPRRVVPDAGQGQQGVVIGRQLPAVLRRRSSLPSAGCAPGCSNPAPPTACAAFPPRIRPARGYPAGRRGSARSRAAPPKRGSAAA